MSTLTLPSISTLMRTLTLESRVYQEAASAKPILVGYSIVQAAEKRQVFFFFFMTNWNEVFLYEMKVLLWYLEV